MHLSFEPELLLLLMSLDLNYMTYACSYCFSCFENIGYKDTNVMFAYNVGIVLQINLNFGINVYS